MIGIDVTNLTRAKALPIHLKCLIIDFSALSYIDPSGVVALQQLINDFNRHDVNVFITNASGKKLNHEF